MELVDLLLAFQRRRAEFTDHATEAAWLLGPFFAGERTELDACADVLDWLELTGRSGFALDRRKTLAFASKTGLAARAAEKLRSCLAEVRLHVEDIAKRCDLHLITAFGVGSLEAEALTVLLARLREYSRSVDRYAEWVTLARCDEAVRAGGAVDLAERLAQGRLLPGEAVEELRHARAEALWREAVSRDNELSATDGGTRSDLVAEFRRLEVTRRKAVAALICARHAASMPRGAMGEMAIIRGEIARQRGRMAIRKLMERAGRSVQAIKPIFLMSPISAAQFLPPGALDFDLLVFDEASQVRPEDALGVIARAKQVVVVGDRKQLPPTSFFARLLADEAPEDDDETDPAASGVAGAAKVADVESILTLCEARGLPSRMLRWHYRSRHPSLIEVSNAEFYSGNLVLPPAPTATRDPDGLLLRRVAGAYDRGGKRTNVIEARAVVDAVAQHAAGTPGVSLGVVTFSMVQRDQVSSLLDARRQADPALDAFLSSATLEDTFIKNLENVQGDERDVILISVGYGPRQPGGRLDSMAFGPVSGEGGERRLNVLFTRARRRCEVFVSFDPADVDLGRTTGEGPRVLKRFLTYAETGILDQPEATGRDHDSEFEADVQKVVRNLGFSVDAQVGSAGFRVDLAVRDPERSGRYLLAIECDGATYHSALWARERDRLRQDILESLGWRFHRIWSTDWFHRRQTEIDRLVAALKRVRESTLPSRPTTPPAAAEPTLASPAMPHSVANTPYVVAAFAVSTTVEPHAVPPTEMALIVARIVEIEGPVHTAEVARRIATLFGKERTGSRIAAAAEAGLRHRLRDSSMLREDAGFWFTVGQAAACPIRDRSSMAGPLQRAEMIPPLEVRAAALRCLSDNGSLSRDDITVGIARLLGFQRTGAELRNGISAVVKRLVESGEVDDQNGMLRVARRTS